MKQTGSTRQTNIGKRKSEYDNREPKGETPKGLVDPRIRGSNRSPSRTELPVTHVVKSMLASADSTRWVVMDVVKWDIG